MKCLFSFENNISYVTLEYTKGERAGLDEYFTSLGLTPTPKSRPCELYAEEPIDCFADEKSGVFLEALTTALAERGYATEWLFDNLKKPLYISNEDGAPGMNIALLRIRIPANTPTKFAIGIGMTNPNDWISIIRGISICMRILFSVTFERDVAVNFVGVT